MQVKRQQRIHLIEQIVSRCEENPIVRKQLLRLSNKGLQELNDTNSLIELRTCLENHVKQYKKLKSRFSGFYSSM